MKLLEVSGAVRPLYGSLGIKGLSSAYYMHFFRVYLLCTAALQAWAVFTPRKCYWYSLFVEAQWTPGPLYRRKD